MALRTSGASRLIREILDESLFDYVADENYFRRSASVESYIEVYEHRGVKFLKSQGKLVPSGKSYYEIVYYVGGNRYRWGRSMSFETFAKAMDYYAGRAYSAMKAWEEDSRN